MSAGGLSQELAVTLLIHRGWTLRNDMRTNGELLVQELVLRNYPKDRDLVVFDVGANVGDWSAQLIGVTGSRSNQNCFLHAFEPVSSTMEMLRRTLQTVRSPWRVLPVQKPLSDRQGTSDISVVEEGCGINAIVPDPKHDFDILIWPHSIL